MEHFPRTPDRRGGLNLFELIFSCINVSLAGMFALLAGSRLGLLAGIIALPVGFALAVCCWVVLGKLASMLSARRRGPSGDRPGE